MEFEWDEAKNQANLLKHGIDFDAARLAFFDANAIVERDFAHSTAEDRYLLFGDTGSGIATVRFTLRGQTIRIFGAGYWRQGRKAYQDGQVH